VSIAKDVSGGGLFHASRATPTRRFAPPSPRRRGRDEDRRCGCTVCNDSVRPTKFAPSLRAQFHSLLFPPIYGPRSEARSFFSLPLLWSRDERSSLWGGAKRPGGGRAINVKYLACGTNPHPSHRSLRSRCATLPTSGRDEHRRCGGTVCNDIAQFTNTRSPRFYRDTPTHPRDLAAYTARVMHRVKRI